MSQDVLLDEMRACVAAALDFVIDVFVPPRDNGPTADTALVQHEETIRLLAEQSRLIDDTADDERDFALVLWNDESHSFRDVINILSQTMSMHESQADDLAIAVDNHGRQIVSTGVDLARLLQIAAAIRLVQLSVSIRTLRDTHRENACEAVVDWLLALLARDPALPTSSLLLALRRLVCEALFSPYNCGLADRSLATTIHYTDDKDNDYAAFATASVMTDYSPYDDDEAGNLSDILNDDDDYSFPDAAIRVPYSAEINQALLQDHREVLQAATECVDVQMQSSTTQQENNSPLRPRIVYLMLQDTKHWKDLRNKLEELYVATLIVDQDYKHRFAILFADIYPRLVANCALWDREQHYSIALFSVQLLTTPSIATDLVSNHFFYDKLLALLISLFTARQSYNFGVINVYAHTFRRSHTYLPLLRDLNYLLNAPGVQRLLLNDLNRYRNFLTLLRLFEGIHPQSRYVEAHVEFEATDWVNAFNVTTALAQTIGQYTLALMNSIYTEPKHLSIFLSPILEKLIEQLIRSQSLMSLHIIDSTHPTILGITKRVSEAIQSETLVTVTSTRSTIPTTSISLHHPLIWFFAELMIPRTKTITLFENSTFITENVFDHFQVSDLLNNIVNGTRIQYIINIFDISLSIYVMLSQIHCGVWIRNGYAIRVQYQWYATDASRRGDRIDNDIYMLQMAAVMLGPEHLLTMMISKFELYEWMTNGQTHHQAYNAQHLTPMIEELLQCIIYLITDRTKTSYMAIDMDQQIRLAIIQWLALGPRPHSQLIKVMPSEYTIHAEFDKILRDLTLFRPPDGLTEKGRYELKDEHLHHVNFYYKYYARNHRIELEETMQRKRKSAPLSQQQQQQPQQDQWMPFPIEMPPLLPAFEKLALLVHCTTFTRLLIACLREIIYPVDLPIADSLLEAVCYLIILALQSTPSSNPIQSTFFLNMTQYAVPYSSRFNLAVHQKSSSTLFDELLIAYHHQRFASFKPHVDIILNKISQTGDKTVLSALRDANIYTVPDVGNKRSNAFDTDSTTAQDKLNDEAVARKEAAKERQRRILAEMAKQQASFMSNMAGFDDDKDEDEEENGSENKDQSMNVVTNDSMQVDAQDTSIESYNEQSRNGNNDSLSPVHRIYKDFPTGQCIICQEEPSTNKLYGMLGKFEKSRVARTLPMSQTETFREMFATTASLDCAATLLRPPSSQRPETDLYNSYPPFPTETHCYEGIQFTSCGHLIHYDCMSLYRRNLRAKHDMQPTRNHPEDLTRGEFMCPFCKGLRNVVIPVAWSSMCETIYSSNSSHLDSTANSTNVTDELLTWIKTELTCLSYTTQNFLSSEVAENNTCLAIQGMVSPSYLPPATTIIDGAKLEPGTPRAQLDTALTLLNQSLNMATAPEQVHSQQFSLDGVIAPPGKILSYALIAIEIASREVSSASSSLTTTPQPTSSYQGVFISRISEQTLAAIRTLCSSISMSVLCTSPARGNTREYFKAQAMRLANLLERGSTKVIIPPISLADETHPALATTKTEILIERDPFEILVEVSLFLGDLPFVNMQRILEWMFAMEVVRSLRTLIIHNTESMISRDVRQTQFWYALAGIKECQGGAQLAIDGHRLTELYTFIGNFVNIILPPHPSPLSTVIESDALLCQWIKRTTLPFLRRATLLMYAKYGRIPHDLAPTFNPAFVNTFDASITEFDRLTAFLRISLLSSIATLLLIPLSQSSSTSIVTQYLSNKHTFMAGYDRIGSCKIPFPLGYRLCSLPQRLEELLDSTASFVCLKCKSTPRDTAMCLLCGTFLCMQNFCCSNTNNDGECNQHKAVCSGETGLFLDIIRCKVLVLHNNHGTYMQAPYLDVHGETDEGLSRGKPMFLNERRLDNLRRWWISQELASRVAGNIEAAFDTGNWRTF